MKISRSASGPARSEGRYPRAKVCSSTRSFSICILNVADEVFAKEQGIFGKRLVAGAMVFSLGLGLVAHNNIHTFSYGYDKLRFIKPVFVGDTIYTVRTHLDKWPKYAEMGMVKVSYEVFKMPGDLVLYCEHLQTVKYREPEKFTDQVQRK